MEKLTRQREIVNQVATAPWTYSPLSLAKAFGVSPVTVQRDLAEMTDNGFHFKEDEKGTLYLETSGWLGFMPVKASTFRQMDILRMLSSHAIGLSVPDIYKRLNRRDAEEVSLKTIERTMKELEKKDFVQRQGDKYVIRHEHMLPPLPLNDREKTLLREATRLARALAPIPEEMHALDAKLTVWMGENTKVRETMFVHGRTPMQDVHRSQCCLCLEEAAQSYSKVNVLYRKVDDCAREVVLNPLGLVYYWVLDNWYLIAQDDKEQTIKTYMVDRIIDVTPLAETFPPVQGFNLKTWYQQAWGVYRDHQPIPVAIQFYNVYSTLKRVREELTTRETCKLIENEAGLIFHDQVEGIDELAVWVRGFGAGAEVLEPLALREKVIKEFTQLAQMYGGESLGRP